MFIFLNFIDYNFKSIILKLYEEFKTFSGNNRNKESTFVRERIKERRKENGVIKESK
jgi:hypothetical protein